MNLPKPFKNTVFFVERFFIYKSAAHFHPGFFTRKMSGNVQSQSCDLNAHQGHLREVHVFGKMPQDLTVVDSQSEPRFKTRP